MSRLRICAVVVAALSVTAGMVLAAGVLPVAAGVGSDGAVAQGATAARCPTPVGAEDTAPRTSARVRMAGMAGMAGASPTPEADSQSRHSMQELTDRLARTPSGATLDVAPGIYRGALVIDRPVTLVGHGHATLQGEGTGTVLTIRAAGTTVRDVMVEGSGPGPVGNPAGVSVQADHVVVKNLHIRDVYTGIWVEDAKDAQIIGNVIDGRKDVAVSGQTPRADGDMAGMVMGSGKSGAKGFGKSPEKGTDKSPDKSPGKSPEKSPEKGTAQAGRGDGVSLFSAVRPVVTGNSMVDVRDGVYLEYGSATRIECNSVTDSRYAIHSMYGASVTIARNGFAKNQSGPVMMYGGPLTLSDNVIRDHHSAATGFGALLLDVAGVRLLRNVLVSNRVGLQVEGPLGSPRPTEVELNTVALNQVGVALYPTANASLSQNSLVENTVQVLGMGPDGGGGQSKWSQGGVGNYWSNYRGYDDAGSGVGQTPHVEGAAAGRMLAGSPTLLALASSPAFTLLRAVEQRSAGQHPVSVDGSPLVDPRSPALPSTATHAKAHLGAGLLGASTLALCGLALLLCTRRRKLSSERT